MNSKTEISTNKIVKYLREVSIVVIGVAITLSVTLWISQKNEKRDMTLYLNAVKIELEENIKEIEDAKKYIQLELDYTKYLQSNDEKSRNADTLGYYANSCASIIKKFSFKSNAFDMFKSSGIMRLLDNKELMLTLWETYESLSGVAGNLEWIADYKWEKLKIEIPKITGNTMKAEELIKEPLMYSYYIFDIQTSMMQNIEKILNDTTETVEKLEKYCEK